LVDWIRQGWGKEAGNIQKEGVIVRITNIKTPAEKGRHRDAKETGHDCDEAASWGRGIPMAR